MTLYELRKLVRTKTRDNRAPYFLSDDEIDANLNEAQREACARACLIEDTVATTIDITPSDTRYPLNPRIVDVIDITIGAETPKEYTGDWTLTEGHLLLADYPVADDTLTLHCYLLPSREMSEDDHVPEIRPVYHSPMADWAISLCYATPDAELFNPAAADRYARSFTLAFGERPSALTRKTQRSKAPRGVAYNGYI